MTQQERFLETLLFGAPDRVPFSPGGPRESTLRAWHAQGLSKDGDYMDAVRAVVDTERAKRGLPPGDFAPNQAEVEIGVSFLIVPTFEEKVLEHRDGHYIVQDWMGAVTEISDEYDYTYIRSARDFVTRKWHRWPVASWADWVDRIEWRLDANEPARFPDDFDARCKALNQRDYPLTLRFNGPFWQLREFCGLEGLCTLMLEQPDLVHEMARTWRDFCSALMARVLERVTPDMLHLSEDMCFKEHPMISPEMCEEFCAPCYRQWNDQARAAGVPLFAIDSDGRNDLLIPVWMDCGVNCIDPLEVAAGNDINALRAQYGKRLAFRGGIDKRAMAAGGDVLLRELNRVRPVIDDGGYIPSCDHGVPPDICWQNFQDYALQLAAMTGWMY